MKPSGKIKLVVQASKRQRSLGMFDEVRVVQVQVQIKRERPKANRG